MIRQILAKAYETTDSEILMRLNEAIWQSDRMFTFPAFDRTAKLVVNKYREWGLDAKIQKIPADGNHVPSGSDWRMPMAWDCSKARLEVLSPQNAVGIWADRDRVNCSVAQYSGPTPKHGLEGELIHLDASEEFESLSASRVAGKFILTDKDIRGPVKKKLADLGCLGVVLYMNGSFKCDDERATFWINGWSDIPGGWAFTKGDTPLPGMVLSSEKGRELADHIRNAPVHIRMTIHSRYYDGHIPLPVGFFPGETHEEVIVNAHMAEQGANDNASGCAVTMETMRAVKKMVNTFNGGKATRGLRTFLTSECYGTVGYISRNMGSLKRTIAGLNWDCVGAHTEKQNIPFPVHVNPISAASFTDTLIQRLFEASRKYNRFFAWYMTHYYMGDTFLMDPKINVPLVYGGGVDKNWHTSIDTIDKIDPDTLKLVAAISTAYAYFLVTAGEKEAIWLAEQTAAIWRDKIVQKAADDVTVLLNLAEQDSGHKPYAGIAPDTRLSQMLDTLTYYGEAGRSAVMSCLKLVDRTKRAKLRKLIMPLGRTVEKSANSEIKRLKALVDYEPREYEYPSRQFAVNNIPVKTFFGPATFDSVPKRQRRLELLAEYGSLRWNSTLQFATFNANGKRTLDEIIRRTNAEKNGHADPEQLVNLFRGLAEAGLVTFKRVND